MPDPTAPSRSTPSHGDLIHECFTELHNEREHFSDFLGQSFAQLDGWRGQIEQHWRQLTEERSELVRQRQTLDKERQRHGKNLAKDQAEQFERLESLEGELATAHGELSNLQKVVVEKDDELERQRHALVEESEQHHREQAAQLAGQTARIDTLESELVVAHGELSELQISHTDHDRIASEKVQRLEEARDQFADKLAASQERAAQLEKSLETLARAQDALETMDRGAGDSQPPLTSHEDLEEAIQELAMHKQQVTELQNEREALEQELDTVRVRACELNDTVDVTKRQMAEQQAQWARELTQMRQVLEQQADTITAGRASAPVAPVNGGETPCAGPSNSSDQVVGSVMAQFDKIRQQRAQRNADRTASKQLQNDCA